MCLIPCDNDCIYQEDGYCKLETPTIIEECSEDGCMHYIKKTVKNDCSYNSLDL